MTATRMAPRTPNALSLHHDLWVELARVEMAMEKLDGHPAGSTGERDQLERRRMRLHHAMQSLSE